MKHVYILAVNHRHGENLSAHATEESAEQALFDYVEDEWGGEIDAPFPQEKTQKEIVDEYFERVEREYADICKAEVRP